MPLFLNVITYQYNTANGTEGSYNENGDWVKGESALSTFRGTVQPTADRDMSSLVVGREDKGTVKIYSDIQLPASKEGSGETGAIVFWRGEKWEVITDGVYSNGLIPHYKSIAQYVGEGEPPV